MRTLLLLFLYILIAILSIPVLILCAIFRWLGPVVFIGRTGVRLGTLVLGIRLEITGLDNVDPAKTYIFMPNHLSMIDGPLMFIIIPQFMCVILKKEIFKVPILAQAMKLAGFIPVDRKGQRGGQKAIEKAVLVIKEKNLSFLIFPEGTRSLDGNLQRFRRGGFYLALHSQTPIVPITIRGSYELMPKGSFFAKKGNMSVHVHPPVAVSGYDEDSMSHLIENVRNIVAAGKD